MTKEFDEILEAFEKGGNKFGLSDYCILGEDLTIIKALGEQLTIYTDIISHNDHYHKGMYIEISIDALSGLGKAIMRIAEQMDDKIDLLDERCVFEPRIPDKEKGLN